MEYRNYIINLYDIYCDLLTEKQKNYFEDYYFNNLSLSEMSENLNVSRNAIHKNIKDTEEKLNNYESILKIYEKNNKIKKIISNCDKRIKEEIEEIL